MRDEQRPATELLDAVRTRVKDKGIEDPAGLLEELEGVSAVLVWGM